MPPTGPRREKLLGGLHTGIETVNLSSASKMVSEYSGMMVQKHKVRVWNVVRGLRMEHDQGCC